MSAPDYAAMLAETERELWALRAMNTKLTRVAEMAQALLDRDDFWLHVKVPPAEIDDLGDALQAVTHTTIAGRQP